MADVTVATAISLFYPLVTSMPAEEWQRAKWGTYLKTDLRMCGFVRWKGTESMKNSANAPSAN